MHCFSTKLSSFCFCFVFFSFFFPPPILGIRSLAGGRREYGRSGREPLFYLFYMLLIQFSCILSGSFTFPTKVDINGKCFHAHLVCITFKCFHLFQHWFYLNFRDYVLLLDIKSKNNNTTPQKKFLLKLTLC